jgi:Flp pilus assembly protein CpaB
MAKATRRGSLEAIYPDSQAPASPPRPQVNGRRALIGFIVALVAITVVIISLKSGSRTELVVSVKAPVAAGSVITSADLGEASLPVGASVPSIPAAQQGGVVGQVARVPLYPGDIIEPHDVGSQPSLPPGDIAMTLSLAPEQALGGTLRANDVVDVFAAPTTVAPGAAPAAAEVLSGIPVRAVATPSTVAGSPTVFVTLVLSPAQATSLDAVYRADKVDLALTNR